MLNVLSSVIVSKIDLFACVFFFFIRDAETNQNSKITCNLGQLLVSGGSLSFCVHLGYLVPTALFHAGLDKQFNGLFIYKSILLGV